MTRIEEVIAMPWGIHGSTLVCTGEQGEGFIVADTEAGLMLSKEEAIEIAKHIVSVHNDYIKEEVK